MSNSDITIVGNLADDPELRFTPNGQAVARMRVAVGDRYFDRNTGEWVDRDPSWFSVNCWRNLAENAAESLKRGDRVVITGRMQQRSYEKDDQTFYVWDIEATDVGASLMFASASIRKATRTDRSETEDQAEDEVAAKRTTKSSSSTPPRRTTSTRSRR